MNSLLLKLIIGGIVALLLSFLAGAFVMAQLVKSTLSTQPAPLPPPTVALAQGTQPAVREAATPAVVVTPTPTPPATATPVPTSTPTPLPTATPTPLPKAGDLLYQADWSSGTNDWAGSKGWQTTGGMLVSSGDPNSNDILAPYQVPVGDYAIEAEVQVVAINWGGFYIITRQEKADKRYLAGVETGPFGVLQTNILPTGEKAPYDPGKAWHKYRVEVKVNTIKLFIDGTLHLTVTDNRYLTGRSVGLHSNSRQINVRSFTVIAL